MSPYRNPDPPPRERGPSWLSRFGAWLGRTWEAVWFPLTLLGGVVAVIGAFAWIATSAAQRNRDTCERVGTAIGVPVVVESDSSYCIGANPETGRVERFTPDLYERRTIVVGMNARTREILGEPPPPRLLPSGAP